MPHWLRKCLTAIGLIGERVAPDPSPGPKVYLEDTDGSGIPDNEFDGISLTDGEKAELEGHFRRLRGRSPC